MGTAAGSISRGGTHRSTAAGSGTASRLQNHTATRRALRASSQCITAASRSRSVPAMRMAAACPNPLATGRQSISTNPTASRQARANTAAAVTRQGARASRRSRMAAGRVLRRGRPAVTAANGSSSRSGMGSRCRRCHRRCQRSPHPPRQNSSSSSRTSRRCLRNRLRVHHHSSRVGSTRAPPGLLLLPLLAGGHRRW
jgi:hypothetical protein